MDQKIIMWWNEWKAIISLQLLSIVVSSGVLYVGTTEPYFQEARISAESLKEHNHIKTAIITSAKLADPSDCELFDELIVIDEIKDDVRDKIHNLNKSPFDRTVYLDHDTLIIGDITPVFDLLERVDIAAAIAPVDPVVTIAEVPDCFPELNTGVLVYDSSNVTCDFFDDWAMKLDEQIEQGRPNEEIPGKDVSDMESINSFGRLHGQPPFREALFKCGLQFSILPREYNFRGYGASAHTEVKIVHDQNRHELSPVINKNLGQRVYISDNIYWRNGRRISLKDRNPDDP